MADKVAKLPSLVNNLITNQGVTLFTPVECTANTVTGDLLYGHLGV
jgi:hypothetical protein